MGRGWCVSPSNIKWGSARLLSWLDYGFRFFCFFILFYSAYAQTHGCGNLYHACAEKNENELTKQVFNAVYRSCP